MPSLQVISFPSEVLDKQLNKEVNGSNPRPFMNDIAYGSIVGTKSGLAPGAWVNAYVLMEPHYEDSTMTRSYFPWFSGLDGGAAESDAIVPIWSQELPARAQAFPVNHIGYTKNGPVREQVRKWLNNPELPQGGKHRHDFPQAIDPQDDASRRNAYVGSWLTNNDRSVGADVETDAIVRVREVKASHPEADFHVDPVSGDYSLGSKGGLVTFVCTGMVQNAGRKLSIRTSWGTKLQTSIPIPFSGTPGVLATFVVVAERIGRTLDADIIGPNGQENNGGLGGATWNVVYKVSGGAYAGWTERESAPVKIEFPKYVLPPPEGSSPVPPPPGNPFTVTGGVPCTAAGGGTQQVNVQLMDWNLVSPNRLLVKDTIPTPVPAQAFANVLIPYVGQLHLYKDTSGWVAGKDGTSKEAKAEVYQQLIVPGPTPDQESSSVSVQVEP